MEADKKPPGFAGRGCDERSCPSCLLRPVLGGPLMDVQDSAAFLRVSKSMVYKLAEKEALRAVLVGKLVRSDSGIRRG